jgi:hypothetical protein
MAQYGGIITVQVPVCAKKFSQLLYNLLCYYLCTSQSVELTRDRAGCVSKLPCSRWQNPTDMHRYAFLSMGLASQHQLLARWTAAPPSRTVLPVSGDYHQFHSHADEGDYSCQTETDIAIFKV